MLHHALLILKRGINHPGTVAQLKDPATNPVQADVFDKPFDS